MKKSDAIGELAKALSKVQAEIKGAVKDSTNPFFKANYADLSSVWEACRIALTSNGLSVVQTTDEVEGGVVVETTLLHTSGEWIGGRLALKPTKNDPQGIGSAITYGRRYALAAIVGVCPEDDDGEIAMGRKEEKKTGISSKPHIPQEPPAPSQGAPAPPDSLSFEDLMKKIMTSKNEFELKGRWTKYAASIKVLSDEGKKKLNAAKDKQKELFRVCTSDTATCKHTLSDGQSVGCDVIMTDCPHFKEAK